jgi:4-hydroxythreonine-4-phosphate dehydrogenase
LVPNQLTPGLIEARGRATARGLQRNFGITDPRLAVAGLNPHAGEGGSLGTEEQDIIRPAIDALRAEGWHVIGPLPADTMFHEGARSQ